MTSKWVEHLKSVQAQDLAQDFRRINKSAVRHRVRDAREMSRYRRHVDIRLHPGRNEDGSTTVRRPVDRTALGRGEGAVVFEP